MENLSVIGYFNLVIIIIIIGVVAAIFIATLVLFFGLRITDKIISKLQMDKVGRE